MAIAPWSRAANVHYILQTLLHTMHISNCRDPNHILAPISCIAGNTWFLLIVDSWLSNRVLACDQLCSTNSMLLMSVPSTMAALLSNAFSPSIVVHSQCCICLHTVAAHCISPCSDLCMRRPINKTCTFPDMHKGDLNVTSLESSCEGAFCVFFNLCSPQHRGHFAHVRVLHVATDWHLPVRPIITIQPRGYALLVIW